MLTLTPYPQYKESGLPWLGKIPAHWELRRNGRLFAQRVETGFPDLPILEVSLRTGVHVRDLNDTNHKQLMSNREQYKRAAHRDIAYNMMRMWQGAVGMVPTDGLVSPAYVVARPFPEADARYYSYLFRTATYMDEVNKFSRGIVTDRNRLYWDEFKQMPSAFPPSEEQRAIAKFLDDHGRVVRHLIGAKRRLIELLNEQQQAIIHRTLTHGLAHHVRLKPSGIDWLGDVPEHWEVVRLRRLVTLNPSKSESCDENDDGTVVFLPMERVSEDGKIDCTERRKLKEVCRGFTYFRKNDLLLAKITPCFENGKGAYLEHLESAFGFGSTEFMVLRAGPRIHPKFLYQITMSSFFRRLGKEAMTGAAGQQRVPSDFVKNFDVALPPLDEQEQILSFFEEQSIHSNTAVQRAQREIDLVREYRTRLIADVVMGKLDVRGVELPELEETAVLDDFDDSENVTDLAEETGEVEALEEEDGD